MTDRNSVILKEFTRLHFHVTQLQRGHLHSEERRRVEAGRIELPSAKQSQPASTCLFRTLNSPAELLRTGSLTDYSTKFKIPTADE